MLMHACSKGSIRALSSVPSSRCLGALLASIRWRRNCMVLCQHNRSNYLDNQIKHLPESSFDTLNIVLLPVSSRHLLLSHRNPVPCHPHNSHTVRIILIENNLQLRVMPRSPLCQSPLLQDLRRLLQYEIFPRDITSKELELPTNVGTLESFGRSTREGCDPLGVGKSRVKFFGCSLELGCRGQGGCVHGGRSLGWDRRAFR